MYPGPNFQLYTGNRVVGVGNPLGAGILSKGQPEKGTETLTYQEPWKYHGGAYLPHCDRPILFGE